MVKSNDKKFLLPSEFKQKYNLNLKKIQSEKLDYYNNTQSSSANKTFQNYNTNCFTINTDYRSKNRVTNTINTDSDTLKVLKTDFNFESENISISQDNYSLINNVNNKIYNFLQQETNIVPKINLLTISNDKFARIRREEKKANKPNKSSQEDRQKKNPFTSFNSLIMRNSKRNYGKLN